MSDKSFKEYLAESAKDYKYTLKIAIDDISEDMLDKIEYCLEKYQLVSASAFKKTPIQESPLDFPNVRNHSVHISDLIMKYPASRDFLETFISQKLAISEQNIVVYSENDPRQIETELHLERSSPEYKEQYESMLGKEYQPVEGIDQFHTDKQVEHLKDALASSREDRTAKAFMDWDMSDTGNDLIGEQAPDDKVLPSDYDTFNDQAPKESFSLFGRLKKYGD